MERWTEESRQTEVKSQGAVPVPTSTSVSIPAPHTEMDGDQPRQRADMDRAIPLYPYHYTCSKSLHLPRCLLTRLSLDLRLCGDPSLYPCLSVSVCIEVDASRQGSASPRTGNCGYRHGVTTEPTRQHLLGDVQEGAGVCAVGLVGKRWPAGRPQEGQAENTQWGSCRCCPWSNRFFPEETRVALEVFHLIIPGPPGLLRIIRCRCQSHPTPPLRHMEGCGTNPWDCGLAT